jgi:hypothetical protein
MKLSRSLAGATVALALALPAAAPRAGAAETAPSGAAASPAGRALGGEGVWSAYVSEDRTGPVCYLVGEPQKSVPQTARRTPPSARVTHRPQEKIANVVSFAEGYPLKPGSQVLLTVGPRRFDLFTNGDTAWARTSDLDREIVETLAKSREATVRGIPAHGIATIDTYPLAGFDKALALIDQACGVKR